MQVVVSRAFCGRRVITVKTDLLMDDRTYFARQAGRGWNVFAGHERIAFCDKVRSIELAVMNHAKAYA